MFAAMTMLIVSEGCAGGVAPPAPPQIDHWKWNSTAKIDDWITIKGDVATFPHLGQYKLEYYGDFPGQQDDGGSQVYVIRPVSGPARKNAPFCAADAKPNEGYVKLLATKDILDKPILYYTMLESGSMPPKSEAGKSKPLQGCTQVTFSKP